jgi:L-2,4-diaminobutyric acid acetyltransferase
VHGPRTEVENRPALIVDRPIIADGGAMWRIAHDSRALDLNSSYSYLLMARDFAQTCAVARLGDEVVGFITGYLRPDDPNTLVVWQVAVDRMHRRAGVANALLDHLIDRMVVDGVRHLETTITSDNTASIGLFTAVAVHRAAALAVNDLFSAEMFPDGHDEERLYRIGPFLNSRSE